MSPWLSAQLAEEKDHYLYLAPFPDFYLALLLRLSGINNS